MPSSDGDGGSSVLGASSGGIVVAAHCPVGIARGTHFSPADSCLLLPPGEVCAPELLLVRQRPLFVAAGVLLR
jgi:hypothetical protein